MLEIQISLGFLRKKDQKILNWKPRYDLENGLRKIKQWFIEKYEK